MKMKLKKTLTAVSAAAVSAGAIAVLALAGQGLAFAQSSPPNNFDTASYSAATDMGNFSKDVNTLCATASQPFANASDPQIAAECSSNGRTVP